MGNSADGMYGLMMVTGWSGMLCKWFLRFSLVGKFNWDWTVTFVWSCNLLGKDFSFSGEHSVIIVSKNVINERKNWLSMIFKMDTIIIVLSLSDSILNHWIWNFIPIFFFLIFNIYEILFFYNLIHEKYHNIVNVSFDFQ